ncbi:hypothetical protein HAX54_004241 [Datura stramonium]|uniref:Uncharacterized protein n=1 Tax=Datura stramonium TaxID=4076 RepID=A0ABS8WV63_DATST|nr:hypothetical protein [Datura stramonium]
MAEGSFTDKTYNRITTILNNITKHNQSFHAGDASGSVNIDAPSVCHLIKENHERVQMMVTMEINISLLTKRLTESELKKMHGLEICKNQERVDTTLKSMAEIVSSHTTSNRKLEQQIRDLSSEQNQKQKRNFICDTIANQRAMEEAKTHMVRPLLLGVVEC